VLPTRQQHADEIDRLLQRPVGWLQTSAGIQRRHIWGDQDAVAAAAEVGRDALRQAGVGAADVGALLVTAEAPPILTGLAAALHARLHLSASAVALEVGGACSGFVAALWLARKLLPRLGTILIVAVESPSRYLAIYPGAAGEAAALFGDGAAACLVSAQQRANADVLVRDVRFHVEGQSAALIQLEQLSSGALELCLQGEPLARRAIRTMAQCVRDLVNDHGRLLTDLAAVIVHGGNGRMPDMVARQLGLPAERVWSETVHTGNLGSASLPVAWANHPRPNGPVAWTAVGAGLTWGSMLTG
jgi:3-oxoacyl-[acyl-carrier-protein] synthase-3